MSNKSLLKENTIRRFMKLASIGPLTETFVDKIKEEEEELEEGGYGMPSMPGKHDDEMDPEMPEEPGLEPGAEEEAPLDLPPEGEEDAGLGLTPEVAEEVAEKLASGFASVVEDALGVEGLMSVEKEGDMDMDMEEPP